MKQDHSALGEAVRERRESLALSKSEASRRAKRYDLEVYPDEAGHFPGISTTAWLAIEQGVVQARREHTLKVLDAVLRWPEGTSLAILNGEEPPTGQPVMLPSENNGHHEDDAALRVELARSRREVAELREDVAVLAAGFEGIRETVDRLLDRLERG